VGIIPSACDTERDPPPVPLTEVIVAALASDPRGLTDAELVALTGAGLDTVSRTRRRLVDRGRVANGLWKRDGAKVWHHPTPMVRHALDYAARGIRVVPGWPVLSWNGRGRATCGCREGHRCVTTAGKAKAGKHPMGTFAPHGIRDATTDPELISWWWERAPRANIIGVTGEVLDVADIDTPEGLDTLDALVPDRSIAGPMALTSYPDGIHVYVAPTGAGVHRLPGLDWMGVGGSVVMPPSVHYSGELYTWQPDLETPLPVLDGLAERLAGYGR
jgi:hypothetical protein